MDAYEAAVTRRSVRTYTDAPIPPRLLERLVRAAMYAPSARNGRPWEFVVVTGRTMLDRLSEVRPYWTVLERAAAAVVVILNEEGYPSPTREFSVQDCAAATENLLLAAHGEGLGAVWLGLHPLRQEQRAVQELLGIPRTRKPFSVVSLGYPALPLPRVERFEAEKLHWETYGNRERPGEGEAGHG